jgi:hypothetical protein
MSGGNGIGLVSAYRGMEIAIEKPKKSVPRLLSRDPRSAPASDELAAAAM